MSKLFLILLSLLSIVHSAEPSALAKDSSSPSLIWLAYDDSMCTPALVLARKHKLVVVLNADNGPGNRVGPFSDHFVAKCRLEPRIQLRGYIDLVTWKGDKWTAKTPSQIAREKGLWSALYGITDADGWWLDDCFANEPAIRNLVTGLKWGQPDKIFANPGEPLKPGHWLRSTGFQICDHEDPLPLKPNAAGPAWIIFGTLADARAAWAAAKARGVRYIGFEDIAKHHRGEFQRPPLWWAELSNLP